MRSTQIHTQYSNWSLNPQRTFASITGPAFLSYNWNACKMLDLFLRTIIFWYYVVPQKKSNWLRSGELAGHKITPSKCKSIREYFFQTMTILWMEQPYLTKPSTFYFLNPKNYLLLTLSDVLVASLVTIINKWFNNMFVQYTCLNIE